MIRYFAYGSNMDKDDLDKWCVKHNHPIVEFLDTNPARLSGYKLCFNHFSKGRDAGAANIMECNNSIAYGLLISLKVCYKSTLESKEGSPYCYNECFVDIETFKGVVEKDVLTFKLLKEKERKEHQPPSNYYMNLILKNAEKYKFPPDYINYLRSLKTKG